MIRWVNLSLWLWWVNYYLIINVIVVKLFNKLIIIFIVNFEVWGYFYWIKIFYIFYFNNDNVVGLNIKYNMFFFIIVFNDCVVNFYWILVVIIFFFYRVCLSKYYM